MVAAEAAAEYRRGDDWRHVQAVLAHLESNPPSVPVVYLLGGSSARECITTERNWRRQITGLTGVSVRAYNFGSTSQSFTRSQSIVERMPEVPSIVLIGVNVGRFNCAVPKGTARPAKPDDDAEAAGDAGSAPAAEEPSPSPAATYDARLVTNYDSHRFDQRHVISDARKREMVRTWMRERYPVFKERYSSNLGTLRQLVAACQDRGFYPVIVELPLNLPIVGSAWDKPRAQYRAGCRQVAAEFGIPYVDFVRGAKLVSKDFVDLSHLIHPGRVKYQRRLSDQVAARLRQYGLAGAYLTSAGAAASSAAPADTYP
jgi:hypothetical protein